MPFASEGLLLLALATFANAETHYLVTRSATNGNLDYSEAVSRCEQLGCVLAKISSKQENDAAIAAATAFGGDANTWIGLNDLAETGKFVWVEDGTTLNRGVDFEDWCAPGFPPSELFPDNPSNGPDAPEHCATLWMKQTKCDGFGRWNDAKCGNKFPQALCRCEVTPSPTTPVIIVDPTDPPTNPPTDPPTVPPTNPPTDPPTVPPTNPPTDPPTNPPTDPPTTPATEATATNAPTVATTVVNVQSGGESSSEQSPAQTGSTDAGVIAGSIIGALLLAALLAFVALAARRRMSNPPVAAPADEWKEMSDPDTGLTFWMNKKTGEFSWTAPAGMEAKAAPAAPAAPAPTIVEEVNKKTGEFFVNYNDVPEPAVAAAAVAAPAAVAATAASAAAATPAVHEEWDARTGQFMVVNPAAAVAAPAVAAAAALAPAAAPAVVESFNRSTGEFSVVSPTNPETDVMAPAASPSASSVSQPNAEVNRKTGEFAQDSPV